MDRGVVMMVFRKVAANGLAANAYGQEVVDEMHDGQPESSETSQSMRLRPNPPCLDTAVRWSRTHDCGRSPDMLEWPHRNRRSSNRLQQPL